MRTLLVVDDEMLIADGLHDILQRALEGRMNVICRYSATAALEAAAEQPVDLLLTDINMPNMTGLELHRAIQERYPECQVIYLTGYSDFGYARTALDQRAFAYLLKGEGDDVVISTVERALETIKQHEAEEQTPEAGEGQDWMRELQEYIRDHLNEDLSLNRLAEVCHFHPAYLSRVYKELTGTTLGDYINRAREEKAGELLRKTRMTVLEISREMGFATDNYFCRWFRKRTGMSPQHYREGKTN